MLSSDLATLFTGRVMEVKVFPFSFSEYVEYFNINGDFFDAFDRYVSMGGMPGSYEYESEEQQFAYIEDVYKQFLREILLKSIRYETPRSS